MVAKGSNLGRWVLQWGHKDKEDGAACGGQHGGGIPTEKPAAEGALRLSVGRGY